MRPPYLSWTDFANIIVDEIKTNKELRNKIIVAGKQAEQYYNIKTEVKKLTKLAHKGYMVANVIRTIMTMARQDWVMFGEFQHDKYLNHLKKSTKLLNETGLTKLELAAIEKLKKPEYLKEFVLLQSKRMNIIYRK